MIPKLNQRKRHKLKKALGIMMLINLLVLLAVNIFFTSEKIFAWTGISLLASLMVLVKYNK